MGLNKKGGGGGVFLFGAKQEGGGGGFLFGLKEEGGGGFLFGPKQEGGGGGSCSGPKKNPPPTPLSALSGTAVAFFFFRLCDTRRCRRGEPPAQCPMSLAGRL